jgi:hypothetical protein
MRATEFVTEVFEPGKKNWKWSRLGSAIASAFFKVGNREYLWQAFTGSNPKKWEIQFRLIRNPEVDPNELDLYGKTGTGNSAQVLSTAVDITRAFIKEYGSDRVEEITFNAKEDSRIGLYARMIQRLLPNWDLYQKYTKDNGMEYHLTDRSAYDKPENKISEEAKASKYKGLVMKYAFNQSALILKAFQQGTPIAYVKFVKENKDLYPQDLWVNDDYRNKGVAKSMYDYLKSEGYIINRSHDQTKAGAGFWDKHRGEDEYVWEDDKLDEMPLPADWDPQQMRQQGTTFKSRLAYALERAKKLGTGSSRVATTIEYEGRPTVLKIAKNQKGLAQNSVEASILDDGYASQMGILIPLIDYDTQNREPSWIHTEVAQKANEKQLCNLMKCHSFDDLITAAQAQLNEYGTRSRDILNKIIEKNEYYGSSEQDADIFLEYVNRLAELKNSFDVQLGDFNRAHNWGLYQGKPVIIDVGLNSNVLNQYYAR